MGSVSGRFTPSLTRRWTRRYDEYLRLHAVATRTRIRIGPCHLCPPKKVCGRQPFSPPHKRVTSAESPPLPQRLRRPHPPHERTGAQALPPARTTARAEWECRCGRGSLSTRPPAQGLPILQAIQPTRLRPASSFLARDLLAVVGALREPKIPVPGTAEVGRGGGWREGGRASNQLVWEIELESSLGVSMHAGQAERKMIEKGAPGEQSQDASTLKNEQRLGRRKRVRDSRRGNHFTSIPPDDPPSTFCWPILALSMRSTHVHIIAAVREHMTGVMEVAVIEEGNGRSSAEDVLTRRRARVRSFSGSRSTYQIVETKDGIQGNEDVQ
ncbi:hypothetical protein B0H14DRAFT_2564272 [Mycena olivaceomarginata]|nr:hypothetical protein B0H14DRAFT_2564272 [Mycena olivaceomarginata]